VLERKLCKAHARRVEVSGDEMIADDNVFGSSMGGIETLLIMTRRNSDAVLGPGKTFESRCGNLSDLSLRVLRGATHLFDSLEGDYAYDDRVSSTKGRKSARSCQSGGSSADPR